MTQSRNSLLVAIISVCSLLMLSIGTLQAQATPPPASDVAVAVSDAQIAAVAAACIAGSATPACVAALKALVAALTLANPNATPSTLIGSIAAKVASVSNAGLAGTITINAVALGAALTALATLASANGLTALAATVVAVAQNVTNAVAIDLGAIASGTGISLGNGLASPA